jgi:hypothetical protein
MISHIIKDIDIVFKTANIYIDGELVSVFAFNPDHPKRSVFNQIINGSIPIHITDYTKIPSIGMIYENGIFIEGENGENFYPSPGDDYLFKLIEGTEAIITISAVDNKVDGGLIMLLDMFNPVEELHALFAALMSNPVIEIVDTEFDSTQQLYNIGDIVNIAQWPQDFQHLS